MVSRWSFVFTTKSLPEDVAKTSYKRLNFGLKDVLDWSEMEVSTTIFLLVFETKIKTFLRRLCDVFVSAGKGLNIY